MCDELPGVLLRPRHSVHMKRNYPVVGKTSAREKGKGSPRHCEEQGQVDWRRKTPAIGGSVFPVPNVAICAVQVCLLFVRGRSVDAVRCLRLKAAAIGRATAAQVRTAGPSFTRPGSPGQSVCSVSNVTNVAICAVQVCLLPNPLYTRLYYIMVLSLIHISEPTRPY